MKRLLGSLFILSLFAIVVVAQKPDSSKTPEKPGSPPPGVKLPAAKEITDKYVKALGGREALLKHKSSLEKGTMELSPMGVKGTFETFIRSDSRVLTRVSLQGIGEILEGFDGTTAWTSNPLQGSRVKEGKELEQVKRLSKFGRDADLASVYDSMIVKGVEKVGERDAYVVVGATCRTRSCTSMLRMA